MRAFCARRSAQSFDIERSERRMSTKAQICKKRLLWGRFLLG